MSGDDSSSSSMEQTGGVILDPPRKKQENSCHWFFFTEYTLVDNPKSMEEILVPQCSHFCFQKEVCPKTKRIHLQGVFRTTTKTRCSAVLKWLPKGIHLEIARSWKDSWDYCSKSRTRLDGPWMVEPPKKVKRKAAVPAEPEWRARFPVVLRKTPEVWRDWQKQVLDWVGGPPDERSVLWIHDEAGKMGKTTLGHEICTKYGGVPVNGELRDVLALATERPMRVYLVVAPRDQPSEKFPYSAMEMLKDGLWMKGKFEVTCVVRQELVHVVVLANCLPILSKLTLDRWTILSI